MFKLRIVLFLALWCLAFNSFAQNFGNSVVIISKQGETLFNLLYNRVGLPEEVILNKRNMKRIRLWNPWIKNPDYLEGGHRLYLKLPNSLKVKIKEGRHLFGFSERKEKREPKSFTFWDIFKLLNYSVFYMYSKGSYTESVVGSDLRTISDQDSPVTFGLSAFGKMTKIWNLSSSFYASSLDPAFANEESDAVSNPWEYGGTLYLEYQKKSFALYSGIDYEIFPSYNTNELIDAGELSIVTNSIGYLTFGVTKKFKIFGRQFLTKLSFSQSVSSSQSGSDPNTFSGNKSIFYVNTKVSEKVYIQAFYKQHQLIGSKTSLNLSRLGLGIGTSF